MHYLPKTTQLIGRCGIDAVFRPESADRDVVDDLFDLLEVVFEAVEALPQRVVLQVQQAKTGVDVRHELSDAYRAAVIARRDRIDREARLKSVL